tara:strand:+ start:200 stop:382 length:183 start_codon:yes stop_codon:yes gene_type:complete
MSSFLEAGIKPKYMGKISGTNNFGSHEVKHRYSLLEDRKFIFQKKKRTFNIWKFYRWWSI